MIITQNALDAVFRGYSMIYSSAFEATPTFWERLATRVNSESKQNTYPWHANMPGMREWVGERVIVNSKTYDYTVENRQFESTMAVKRAHLADDQLGLYNQAIQMMAQSAAQHPDELITELILAGETKLCFDNQPFFDVDHPINPGESGSAVYSNLLSATPLTQVNYAAARAAMIARRGDNGKSLKIQPNLLVVPPALEFAARQILSAEVIGNNTNVYRGTAELLVVPELAGNDADWYLLDVSKPIKPFVYQVREEITFTYMTDPTSEAVFSRDEFVYGAQGRSAAGYALPFLATKCKG